MEQTLQECSNNMLMQLVIGVIIILIQLVLSAGFGAVFFMIRRLIKTNDALPDQFARVHGRISKGEAVDAAQDARIKNLERRPT